jgi:hypothetical protein
MSLAGGTERHLEVESLCFLEMSDHLEEIAGLRIAAGTERRSHVVDFRGERCPSG